MLTRWTPVKAAVAALVIGLLAGRAIGVRVDDWTDFIGAYFIGVILLLAAVVVTAWIFGPPRELENRRAPAGDDLQRALVKAQALTTAYSQILQTPRDHFWPLSKLPADKETMKAALKMAAAYWATKGELDKSVEGEKMTLRDAYVSTYAMLADFVPDDLAARVNPLYRFIRTTGERLKAGEQMDMKAHAEQLAKVEPSEDDQRASARALGEFQILAAEMTAYLDRMAPRKGQG